MSLLGRIRHLVILRESDHGMYLDAGQLGEVLLPTREVPPEVEPGDEVTVFVARDSEDRVVATTTLPYAQAGEIKGLKVLEVHPRLGAFLDFGLAKDLLLPFAEQSKPVKPGETVVVRILVDPKTDRSSPRASSAATSTRPRPSTSEANPSPSSSSKRRRSASPPSSRGGTAVSSMRARSTGPFIPATSFVGLSGK